jgi:hypothetical protein
MTARGLTSLPLYPEDRDCLAPVRTAPFRSLRAANTAGCVDRTPSSNPHRSERSSTQIPPSPEKSMRRSGPEHEALLV